LAVLKFSTLDIFLKLLKNKSREIYLDVFDMNINKQEIPWWQPGMFIFIRLSGWIAGPIIAAVFIGKWLDKKYNAEPWIFLFCVGLAFVVSSFGIVKEAKEMMNKIIENEKEKRNIVNDKKIENGRK
jgi:MFS family permease